MLSLSPALQRAFDLIEKAANAGAPCPTNEAIARHMRIRSIGTASGYLSRLRDLGVIRLERGQNSRIVTIVATGRRTSGPPSAAHVSRGRVAEHRQVPLSRHVSREPCPRCGARADFGCGHSGQRLSVGIGA